MGIARQDAKQPEVPLYLCNIWFGLGPVYSGWGALMEHFSSCWNIWLDANAASGKKRNNLFGTIPLNLPQHLDFSLKISF